MKPVPNADAGRDDTALSVMIGYIINLGIAAVVVSLTLILLQGVFVDAQDRAVESEMKAIGEDFASELERVDIMSSRTDSDVSTTVSLPESDNPYTVTVLYDGLDDVGRVHVDSRRTSVNVAFVNTTTIADAREGINVPRGSEVEIKYDAIDEEIDIND